MPQTDKIGHGYEPTYMELFRRCADRFDNELQLLEIGVAQGEGLEWFHGLWLDYVVSYAESRYRLTGVDNNPNARTPNYVPLIRTDQQNPILAQILWTNGYAPFNIIVDDASHDPNLTRLTLQNLWPTLVPGGWYVIEDWTHANMILGPLAVELPLAFGRKDELPGLETIMYRDGLIILEKAQS